MVIDSCILGATILAAFAALASFIVGVTFVWWFEYKMDPKNRHHD